MRKTLGIVVAFFMIVALLAWSYRRDEPYKHEGDARALQAMQERVTETAFISVFGIPPKAPDAKKVTLARLSQLRLELEEARLAGEIKPGLEVQVPPVIIRYNSARDLARHYGLNPPKDATSEPNLNK